ncbi:MAG: hypothetical protein HY778_15500 [Betaproteobacteria bacterium]|nr:hypothetical protein [Betaproteobacteria bacterium]
MRIGTPLSASATRVMLPGSGELGKEVIIALQRRGVALATGADIAAARERARLAASRVRPVSA